jgi:hypothetical protein
MHQHFIFAVILIEILMMVIGVMATGLKKRNFYIDMK